MWYEEPGDFRDESGTLVCGRCGRPKEDRFGFPIVHWHQVEDISAPEETPEARAERIAENRRRCFGGEFRELSKCIRSEMAPDTPRELLGIIDAYVADFTANRGIGRGLMLFGPVGRGKTHAAACACNMVLDGGWRCLMTSTRRIRSQVESRYGSLNAVLDSLCSNDLVVLDDLFRDRNTEAGNEAVFDVVDALYKMRVPVIVTTNMSRNAVWGPPDCIAAAVDRLRERCQMVELPESLPNRRQMVLA